MKFNSRLFAATSTAMMTLQAAAADILAYSTRGAAFSYSRRLKPSRFPPFRRLSLAFVGSSSSHSSSDSATAAVKTVLADGEVAHQNVVSPTTERMRVESEQEMSRLLERLADNTAVLQVNKNKVAIMPLLCTTRSQVAAYIQEHDINSILFDCDGVVYRSPDPAPGARACMQSLVHNKMHIYFVTNNAATNRAQLRDKLVSILDMDHDDDDSKAVLTEDIMVPSSFAAAQYLKQHLLLLNNDTAAPATTTGRVFVIGSPGLVDELQSAGFTIVGDDDDEKKKTSMTRDELADCDFSELHPIDAVVVGHDTNLHFRKLAIAQVLLQKSPHALLVATNTDAFDLVGAHGFEIPGNGGAVKFLEWTTRRTAINCGKPSPILAGILHDLYGLDTSRALFVGDRLDTDIQFGIDTGMHTALVLTGVTTGHQMADILIEHHQNEANKDTQHHAIPSIILPHIGLLA